MNKLYLSAAGAALLSTCSLAQAEDVLTNGAGNVVCNYSHTLPDDPIIYPERAGIAMSHDFFGNTKTDAHSTGDTLLAQNETTCNNVADSTAYWAPSLRLPDGTVVRPLYQKTYYNNIAVPSSKRYAVQPFPTGLQILAGNHNGTAPNPNISFLCTGRNYTGTIPTNCVPDPKTGTQFNIGVSFPTCWDGKNLEPAINSMMQNGKAMNMTLESMMSHNNVAYANKDGSCPVDYPVRIPHISMNIAYKLGNITDLTDVQLSLDPTLDEHGKVIKENWGSLYTAHGDFFAAWREASADFMAKYCLNAARECDTKIAYSYNTALADSYVVGGAEADKNFGTADKLLLQRAEGNTPEGYAVMRFAIPEGIDKIPANYNPAYHLLIYGVNTTDTTSNLLYIYGMENQWDENSITHNNAPTCVTGSGAPSGNANFNGTPIYRPINITSIVKAAADKGEKEVSVCVKLQSGSTPVNYSLDSKEGTNKPVLYLLGVDPKIKA